MKRRKVASSIFLIGVLVGTISLLSFFWFRKVGREPSCPDCNIILIVIDPLRVDALPVYGNQRTETPTLDALANRGVVFTNAFAVSSWTLPSAMSLMAGVYPSVHKITNKELIPAEPSHTLTPANLAKAAPGIQTLASQLKANGYVTGGFAGGAALDPSYGFSQGFDEYVSDGSFEGLPTTSPKAIDFISRHRSEKMFVFIHGFDVHGQYEPVGGYDRRYVQPTYKGKLTGSTTEQKALREEGVLGGRIYLSDADASYLRSLYDEKVSRIDVYLKKIIDEIALQNIAHKTIILVTSDHGDEFYEHGRVDHGMTLFDEVLRIPLILTVPGMSDMTRIRGQVRNIDIIPTLLALIGHAPSGSFTQQLQGVNLLPLMSGKDMKLDLFAETQYRYATFQKAIRIWDGWKLVYDEESQMKQLYLLTEDPKETTDLFETGEKRESELLEQLMRFINNASDKSQRAKE